MRAQAGASSAVLLVTLLLGGALLGAPARASAEGAVTFLRMTADRCPESSGCEFRLSCGIGNGPQLTELVPSATARTKYSVDINKVLEIKTFPTTIQCTAWEDDGWFSASWEPVGSATVQVPSGGNYKLNISSKEQGALHVDMAVDSLEVAPGALPPPPPPAPTPATTGAKPAKAPAKAPAPLQYLAAFAPQKDGHAVVIGLDEKAFKAKVAELSALGLQIDDFESFDQGGKRLWSAIFRNSSDQVQVLYGQDWDKFSTAWKKLTGGKMRLTDIEVYPNGNQNYFAGIFRDLGESHSLWVGQTRKDFESKVSELASNKSQRLLDFEAYGSGNTTLYAGTFREDLNATEFWTGTKVADFLKRASNLRGKNLQIVDVETFKDGKDRVIEAVARTGAPGEVLIAPDVNAFVKRWREMVNKGERLVCVDTFQE
jgi:polyglycine hydrolase-like protein